MDNCALLFDFSDKKTKMSHFPKYETFSLTLPTKEKQQYSNYTWNRNLRE